MPAAPQHVTVRLQPARRVAVLPVRAAVRATHPEVLAHPQVLYSAHHTTAGFLDAEARRETGAEARAIRPFLAPYRALFPYGAGYRHDQMHLRTELRPAQRRCEPHNADAHLTYIGAGLTACAHTSSETEVALVDLDGVNQETGHHRQRYVTALGFTETATVTSFEVPVPAPQVERGATSLHDPRLDLVVRIQAALARYNVSYGCVRLALTGDAGGAALVINEFEPQLMHHDVARVLRTPQAFSQTKQIPAPAGERSPAPTEMSFAERPEDLRLSSTCRLMVRPPQENSRSRLVQGRYQSPILLHWEPRPRTIEVTVERYT